MLGRCPRKGPFVIQEISVLSSSGLDSDLLGGLTERL